MSFYRNVLSLVLLAGIIGTPTVFAQVKPIPPPKEFKPETQEPRRSLPSLNLPEYIITGADVITFSGYTKENISLSDEETFSQRAGRGIRESWYGDPKPVKDLISPSRVYGNAYSLYARAGYGSYSSPLVEAWYNNMFSKGDVNAHLLYNASDGHVTGADFNRFEFDINGGSWFPATAAPIIARARMEGMLGYRVHDYNLYANTIAAGTPPIYLQRSKTEADFGAGIVSRENSILDYSASFFGKHTLVTEDLTVHQPDVALDYEHSEIVFGLNATANTHIGTLPLHTHLTASLSDLADSDNSMDNPSFFELGAMSEYWFSDAFLLRFGLDFYSLGNSDGSSHTSVLPLVNAEYYFNKDMHAFAGFMPEVHRNSFRDLLSVNPYVTIAPEAAAVLHQETPLAFRLGAQYDDRQKVILTGFFDYRKINDYPIFTRLAAPYTQQWGVHYEGATSIISINASAELHPTTDDVVTFDFTVRDSENDALGTAVPYLANYELSFLYLHRFPFGLEVQGTAKLLGDRHADEGDLGTVLFIAGQAEYWLLKNIGAFIRLSNVINQDYQVWQGYDAVPFFFSAGIKARF